MCGSDGVTYSNSCFLELADCQNPHVKITLAHEGECKKCPEACNKMFAPGRMEMEMEMEMGMEMEMKMGMGIEMGMGMGMRVEMEMEMTMSAMETW